MGTIAANFVVAHQDYFIGIVAGIALAHIPNIVLFAFHAAIKIPWVRSSIISNPEKAKSVINQISAELDKDIDEEVAKEKLKP